MCPPGVSRIYFTPSSDYQDICSHPAPCCLSFYQLHWQGFPDGACKGFFGILGFASHFKWLGAQVFFFPSLLFGVSISSQPCIALLIPVQKCFSSGDNEENLFPTKASLTPHPKDPFLLIPQSECNIFPFYILFKSQFIKGFTGSSPFLPFNFRAWQVLSAEPHWFLQCSLSQVFLLVGCPHCLFQSFLSLLCHIPTSSVEILIFL